MSRKSKIDSGKKVEIVERVLADEISLSEAALLPYDLTQGNYMMTPGT